MQSSSKTVSSGGSGTLTSRSRSKKPSAKQNSWHELEILSKAELISKLYREFNGVSTLGSKVSLMCRIRIYQSIEFVHSKRLEMEISEMLQYKQWRLSNASHLGTNLDPEAEKYELPPPNFFTGEVSQISHDTLFAQTNEVLSTYIRDHFFGYPAGGKKELLVGRIRVLLRFPKDQVSDSQMRDEEIYEAELIRNYLTRIRQEKEYEQEFKKRRQQKVDEAAPKQLLLKEAFAKHPSMLPESSEGKASVSTDIGIKVGVSVDVNNNFHDKQTSSQLSTDNIVSMGHQLSKLSGNVDGASGNVMGSKTMRGSVGTINDVPLESTCANEATSKSLLVKQQASLSSGFRTQRQQAGEVADTVSIQYAGGGLGDSTKRCSETMDGSVGITKVPFESSSSSDTMYKSVSETLRSCGEIDLVVVQDDHNMGLESKDECAKGGELGPFVEAGNCLNEGCRQTEADTEKAVQNVLHKSEESAQTMVEVNTSLESCASQPLLTGVGPTATMSPVITRGAIAAVESDMVSLESQKSVNHHLDLSAKISEVLRDIEKSTSESTISVTHSLEVGVGDAKELVEKTASLRANSGMLGGKKTSCNVAIIEGIAGVGSQLDVSDCSQDRPDGTGIVENCDQGQDDQVREGRSKSRDGHGLQSGTLAALLEVYESSSEEEVEIDETKRSEVLRTSGGGCPDADTSFELVMQRGDTHGMKVAPVGAGQGGKLTQASCSGSTNGAADLCRLVSMYASMSDDDESEGGSVSTGLGCLTYRDPNSTLGQPLKVVATPQKIESVGYGEMALPMPAVGMSIPSWDSLLRGRKAADVRGYVQKYFPHVNVECSTPILAAKIRVLVRQLPLTVTNEELDGLVCTEGEGYKDWYQSEVLGRSAASVTTMKSDNLENLARQQQSVVIPSRSPKGRFASWADSSSDEENGSSGGRCGQQVEQEDGKGGEDSADDKFLLAARLVLLGEGDGKAMEPLTRAVVNSSSLEVPEVELLRGAGMDQEKGADLEMPKGCSPVGMPVESEWVGAAAYMEYSRLVLTQPDCEVGGRSRGLLLSSMTEAMRIITGQKFSDGPCHKAILDNGLKVCKEGWSHRLIALASPSVGAEIRAEINQEMSRTVEYVFEIYYRYFFSKPNRFHYRYGAVFASMHGYQIQIWTVDSVDQYAHVATYGCGPGVSRWLVRDLVVTPSRIELLVEASSTGRVRVDIRLSIEKITRPFWDQVVTVLESAGAERGVVVEGCFISSAALLQLGRGGRVAEDMMTAWCRICQCINSNMYIASSKEGQYIDSVWFLPPGFFRSILIQMDDVVLGYDVLRFSPLLTDIERLRAKILIAPYCPHNGHWGAGLLHVHEHDVGYIEHGGEFSSHPGTAIFLQAFRDWFNCQYAMKYEGSCAEMDAVAWTTSRGTGIDSFSSDGYDNSTQLMLEMLLLSTGMKKPMEISRSLLERFRWFMVVVMSMSTVRRDQWIQDLSHDICEKDTLQEIIDNVSGESTALNVTAVMNCEDGRESTHSFDFRHKSEKAMVRYEESKVLVGQTSLDDFPRKLLLEMVTVLTEKFTYAEMWLIEHVNAIKVIARNMLASAGVVLGAADFSIVKLAELLEDNIFVEVGDGTADVRLITNQVSLEWWLWANMCSRRMFVEMMSEVFPTMSLMNMKRLWRRVDIVKSEFTLATLVSVAEMKDKAPVIGTLGDTFPSVMRMLTRDLEELSDGSQCWQMSTTLDTSILRSLPLELGVEKGSCSLRMREANDRLQRFVDLLTTYQLEGRLPTTKHVVKMSSWRIERGPDSLVAQFESGAFERWWEGNVICDLRVVSPRIVLRPMQVLLMLEKLDVESKLDHDAQPDLKQAYLLRSLNLKMKATPDPVASKVGVTLDRVIDLLVAQRVEEAKLAWVTAPLSGGDAVGLCKSFYPRLVIEGRWEDPLVYIAQVRPPSDQVVVIGASSRGSVTVVLPDKALLPVLRAQNCQVMYAAFVYCNYGISIDVTLGKYWTMPRGIRLTWIDEGEISDEVASRKDLMRSALVCGMREKRPLWMILGLAPSLDMMVRLSYIDGACFSQSEIASVRCRDSLRTLLASEKASIISFSQARSDYPLGIVGSYGRRTLESMSKEPDSVVSMLVKEASEGRSLDVFTVDHYSTPAEYSTKTLRSMFSVLQWLSERNIISTHTTIEFKNVRASEMTDAFYTLLGKDFVTSRISIDCSPWVEVSMRYAEWLRRREVKVPSDTVSNQFRDSVTGQEVLRLKWQGYKIPKIPVQDTDITESQLSVLGVSRFGEAEVEGGMLFEVPLDSHSWLAGEVHAMRRGSVCVELLPYQVGKAGKRQIISRVYPVTVVEELARYPDGRVPFGELYASIERGVRHKVILALGVKDSGDLCSRLATKMRLSAVSLGDMTKLVQILLETTGTVVKTSWKWRALVETSLSTLQLTLDNLAASHGIQGMSVWQQYGNLGLLEKGAEPISADEFAEQLMLVESLVAAMLKSPKRARIAFRMDTDFVLLRDEVTVHDVQDLQDSVLCVVGMQGEDIMFQLVEMSADVVLHVVRGMREVAHTLTEAMITQSSWKTHSLFWYHKEWQIRLHWVHLALKEIDPSEFCGTPWVERNSRGRQESSLRQKRSRSLGDSNISKRVELARVTNLYESCKTGTSVHRLSFAESIVADKVVVSGFHVSCVVPEIVRQIIATLKLVQLSVEDSQVHTAVAQGGCETSSGLKMYVIPLKKKATFSTRAAHGLQYFFSLWSDRLHVKYGQTVRQERFLIMVSPCPSWLTDIRQPAFVSRGFSGVDSTDMSGVGALGWILRHRFPSEVGDIAFVRVQIRVGFSVSMPGSVSSTMLRYANETIVLHFSANGVRQLSVWSWLERQEHWKVHTVHIPKQGKSCCVFLRDSGLRYDLWKSCKQIIGSGYEHILASADLVGPRPVTILSCRNSAPQTEASLLKLLELWESQLVDLSSIASVGWVSSKMENVKGKKRVHSRLPHLSILWAGDSPRDVPMSIPEFRGLQFDMEVLECSEGMWRSSIAFDGSFISLLPGNIRNYFVTQGQTVLPRKNAIIKDLLSSGWGHTVDCVAGSGDSNLGPLRSALKRSVSYADIAGGEVNFGREEESATTNESGLSFDVREEAKSTVSTLSSAAGDDKVWQEIAKLQVEITALQRPHESSPLEQAFEDRMRQVENATKLLQMQQEQAAETLSEVQRDGIKVAQAVDRMEGRLTDTAGCIRDIRDMLQRQSQMLPPWMNQAVMLEAYRAQLQAQVGAQPGGLLIQGGQRLHGATEGDGAGADRKGSDG